MANVIRHLIRAALTGMCFLAMASSQAQNSGPQTGDPARWYVDDDTAAAQLRTLRKEIGAAFQEAQAQCKRMPAAERSACMKDARATYQQDLANAQQLREAAHPR